jgi:nicotinate-nucleotide adenylyltransferase
MNIGIFGGTFNPPHIAHLITVEHVRQEAGLDKIFFIPSYISPHKQTGEEDNVEDRLAMTRLALEGNTHFEVCDYEVRQAGVSYTYQTLDYLSGRYPAASFFVIIGMDNFSEFHTWKFPDRILAKAKVIVMNRPDAQPRWPEGIAKEGIDFITVPNLEISSSVIRQNRAAGRSITHLVPPGVELYIYAHRLYLSPSQL